MPDDSRGTQEVKLPEATTLTDVRLTITNARAAIDIAADFDNLQRFRLESQATIMQRMLDLLGAGTALYEKIALLNGAIIALSITFLGTLSSKFTAAKMTSKPHLWMIAASWALLIISIYCCYRVIIDRHSSTLASMGKMSKSYTDYFYQRLGVLIKRLGAAVEGVVRIDNSDVAFSNMMETLEHALKKEGEAEIIKSDEIISNLLKNSNEALFARVAVSFTLIAVILLSTFTMLSVRLLF